jgi:hypothetical protein
MEDALTGIPVEREAMVFCFMAVREHLLGDLSEQQTPNR